MTAFLRKIRIDAAVAMTVMQRVWGVAAGLVMVLLTSTLFSKEMQGYYYTFSSLIALQAFFELGLNFVLAQFVSHDIVLLDEHNDAQARQAAIDRIGLLYESVRRWFAVTSVLFAVAVGIGGFVFLRRGGAGLPPSEWAGAWVLIVVAAAINLYYSPQIAIAEGTGKVARVAKLRTIQSVGGYLACWAIIAIHPTLYAVACIGLAMALTSGWWLRRHSGVPEIARRVAPQGVGYGWRKDILPLQWRIGLSWMSGYLLYQVFTPFTFAHRGPAEAAMIGLSIAMFSNISLIGMSWLSATTPVLAGLVARGERDTLRRRFRTLFLQSLAFQIVACAGLCVVVALGRYLEIHIMERFLPTADLAILAVISSCNVAIFAMATFMRVHKEEPMLWNSLVCGLLVTGITYFASFHGATYVLIGYLAVIVLLSVPWTLLLFRRYWQMR
ncbi:hypothetical protein [Sphingomonas faeni]|uniref:hypothetical protein n=1 Tax=Sphingomonas faeni TaxID=185950 RepID=UPI0033514E3A